MGILREDDKIFGRRICRSSPFGGAEVPVEDSPVFPLPELDISVAMKIRMCLCLAARGDRNRGVVSGAMAPFEAEP
jgi:hypothetical protein